MKLAFHHLGIVLSGGRSSRMGSPKALLTTPDGVPLARHQADLLTAAGCHEVVIVGGHDAVSIVNALPDCAVAVNSEWERGRMTSVQCGIREDESVDGYLIIPVDAVGVMASTLTQILMQAEHKEPPALRPLYRGNAGKILWISKRLADELLRVKVQDDLPRLDEWILPHAATIDVDDPAILNNINTSDEWERVKREWENG